MRILRPLMHKWVSPLLILFGGIVVFWSDEFMAFLLPLVRTMWLTEIAMWWSYFLFYFLTIGAVVVVCMSERMTLAKKMQWVIAPLLTLTLGLFLKEYFMILRPTEAYGALVPETAYSFPSIHAAVMASFLPLLWGKGMWFRAVPVFFVSIIGLSRIYLGVHFPSDVVAGVILGVVVTQGVLFLEQWKRIFTVLERLLMVDLEFRRQMSHMAYGIVLVMGLWLDILDKGALFFLLLVGICLIYMVKRRRIPLVSKILEMVERLQHKERFPGRGAFYFTLGSFLTVLFFPKHIALTAIAMLAVGDAVTNLIGSYFGRRHIWYSPRKTWEGTMAGMVSAALVGGFFLPMVPVVGAAVCAMLVETLPPFKNGMELDDNVTIPLTAALVLTILI